MKKDIRISAPKIEKGEQLIETLWEIYFRQYLYCIDNFSFNGNISILPRE